MRDGIRQNTASQSSRPLDSFLFERIEVLKGPASLLYGEGAVGGAINYVSKIARRHYEGRSSMSVAARGTRIEWALASAARSGVGRSFTTALDASQSQSDELRR